MSAPKEVEGIDHGEKSGRWTWGFGEDTKRFIAAEGQKEPRPFILGASCTFVSWPLILEKFCGIPVLKKDSSDDID